MIQLFKRFHWGSSSTVVLGAVVFTLAWPSVSASRTWYVKADGTGDAPTIQAGIDSAVASDIVLVGAGTYAISAEINMKSGVTLTSEAGPFETRIVPSPSTQPVCGIRCLNLGSSFYWTQVSGFWIRGFGATGHEGVGVSVVASALVSLSSNVITDNEYGVIVQFGNFGRMTNCTIVGNGTGLDMNSAGLGELWYNIIWDETAGVNAIAIQNDFLNLSEAPMRELNFSLDPQFCGPLGGNFYLQSDSPCAPGNSPWPELGVIGALPISCGTVKTESKTWGSIKEMYNQ